MGMFDDVIYEDTCLCGEALSNFQTKDGDCNLDKLTPDQVRHFYTSCGKCGRWYDYEVKSQKVFIQRNVREPR